MSRSRFGLYLFCAALALIVGSHVAARQASNFNYVFEASSLAELNDSDGHSLRVNFSLPTAGGQSTTYRIGIASTTANPEKFDNGSPVQAASNDIMITRYTPGWSILSGTTFSYCNLANPDNIWAYDAAGNRATDSVQGNGWSCDNLNRMTASPAGTFTNDVLGNRTTSQGATYGWDVSDRMTSFTPGGGGATNYIYRVDGFRTLKSSAPASTSLDYEGQNRLLF